MTTAHQHTRVVWPPQLYYPPQYQSGASAMYDGSSRHSAQLHGQTRTSRESLRRAEQVRADEALARHVQAQEEHMLLLESVRTAQRERRASMAITHDRMSSRSSTPRPRTTLTPHNDIPIEPFIPPLPEELAPAPAPPRASTPPPAVPSTKSPAQELREHKRIFTKSSPCSRCGTFMQVQPLSDSSVAKQLHLTCSRCYTAHCRGCFSPISCPPNCTALLPSCALQACCSRGRAIAVFELLSYFDTHYTSAAAHVCSSTTSPVPETHRDLFLELITSGAEERLTRRFNRAFLGTLQALRPWLSPRSRNTSTSTSTSTSTHRAVPLLLATSFLLEVVRAYLTDAAQAHVHWVIHGELYVEILGLLTRLGRDTEHRQLVLGQLPRIDRSSGVQACVWDAGSEWMAAPAPADAEGEGESLCALAGAGGIRADLRKMENRGDVETQGLVAQLLMDLNHIVCMNVLN